jgi:putative hemolysin
MSVIEQIAIIVALVLANGFFAGSEIALVAVRTTRLRELADEGHRGAKVALKLRGDPERFLATVQIGITLVGATAAAFGGATLGEPIAVWLRKLGLGRFSEELALALVVVLVSVLSIVLGELVPKSLALRSAGRMALVVAGPIATLAWLARPLVWLLTALSNLLLSPFGDRTQFTEARLSPEELHQLLEEAGAAGSLDPTAADVAQRAIDTAGRSVVAIMVPRASIVALRLGDEPDAIASQMRDKPHARYPVIDDDVIGYAVGRDVYDALLRGSFDLRAVVRRVPFVLERTSILRALRVLQRARTELGIVVDEDGAVTGLVTIEDIVEELLGEVMAEDEVLSERVRIEAPGVYLIDASLPVHEAGRALDLPLPEDPSFSTVAGLALAKAGRIPKPGDRVTIAPGMDLEIVEATLRQVRRVRLRVAEPSS